MDLTVTGEGDGRELARKAATAQSPATKAAVLHPGRPTVCRNAARPPAVCCCGVQSSTSAETDPRPNSGVACWLFPSYYRRAERRQATATSLAVGVPRRVRRVDTRQRVSETQTPDQISLCFDSGGQGSVSSSVVTGGALVARRHRHRHWRADRQAEKAPHVDEDERLAEPFPTTQRLGCINAGT